MRTKRARRCRKVLFQRSTQQALARPPDHVSTHSESGMTRALYDCESVPLTPAGPAVRLVVATHALTSSSRHPLVLSGIAPSMSCLSAPFRLPRLRLRTCWISTCIAARLRPCWPTKTMSRGQIAGILIPPAERRFAQILAQWMREPASGVGTDTLSGCVAR